MANAPRDENQVTTLLGQDDTTGLPSPLLTDSDGNLLVVGTIADATVPDGGTGLTSLTPYAVLTGGTTTTSAMQQVSGVGTSGQILTSNGASALPTWETPTATGGTVTSVSVTTANGVSGSVATATTTPAITLTLGAITPTTTNGLTITANGTNTLNIAAGKTLTASNTLTLTGTDASSVAFGTGGTVVYTGVTALTSLATVSTALTGVLRADSGVLSVDTDVTDLVSAASTTAAGKVELTIASEVTTGTSNTLAVTPDAFAGSDYGIRLVEVQLVEGATNTAIGDGVGNYRFFVPSILNGYNLVSVAAAVVTAGTTGTTDIQIHNVTDAADMLSTKITIDSGEKTSYTAATPPVINAATDDVATGDEIRIDVDAVSTTPAKGLSILLGFQLP